MKKIYLYLFLFFFLFSISACNQKAEPAEQNGERTEEAGKGTEEGNNEQAENKEGSSGIDLNGLFEKTLTASADLKSYSIQINAEQETHFSTEPKPLKTLIQMEMDVTNDPHAFYQKADMDVFSDFGENITMEAYLTEEGYFMNIHELGQWMKFPDAGFNQMFQISNSQQDPHLQIKEMQKYMEDFTYEEDGGYYILAMKASGDKFLDFVKEASVSTADNENHEDSWNGVAIDRLNYTMQIEKYTFLPVNVEIIMEMTLKENGEDARFIQKNNIAYSNWNGVESIIVPKEALEQAIDISDY